MNFIKNINWHDLITSEFWFQIDRARIHTSEKAFLVLGAVLVALGVIAILIGWLAKNKFLALVAVRFAKIFFTIGLLEGFWYLLRMQYAQILGSKFIALLIALAGIWWAYYPIKYLLKNYKEDMAKAAREASRQEYINRKR